MRCIVYDRNGTNAVELEPRIERVTWGMNGEVTDARFSIPVTDSKINGELARAGNIVLLEHADLPPWGGVMWPPFDWENDALKLEAKSPEHYLAYRLIKKQYATTVTASAVMRQAIKKTNRESSLPFKINKKNFGESAEIGGDKPIEPGQSVLDVIKELLDKHALEFWFTVGRSGNAPRFTPYAGQRVVYGLPIEVGPNGNATWGSVVENGEPISNYMVTTQDTDGGETAEFSVEKLMNKYGLWEMSLPVECIPTGGGRPEEVKAAVQQNNITNGINIYVPLGELTKSMCPGSIHLLHGTELGYRDGRRGLSCYVRIDQMSYSDQNGYLDVAAFEYIGTEIEEYIK